MSTCISAFRKPTPLEEMASLQSASGRCAVSPTCLCTHGNVCLACKYSAQHIAVLEDLTSLPRDHRLVYKGQEVIEVVMQILWGNAFSIEQCTRMCKVAQTFEKLSL